MNEYEQGIFINFRCMYIFLNLYFQIITYYYISTGNQNSAASDSISFVLHELHS